MNTNIQVQAEDIAIARRISETMPLGTYRRLRASSPYVVRQYAAGFEIIEAARIDETIKDNEKRIYIQR